MASQFITWAIVDVLTDRIEITDADRWTLESMCIGLCETHGPRFMVIMLD